MGGVRIRLRMPSGQSVLTADDTITVAGLRAMIEEKAAIPASRLELLVGYPPTKMRDDHHIQDGETIIVREEAKPADAASPAVAPKPVAPVTAPALPSSSNDGVVVRKVIPADNNCLFAAIIHVLQLPMMPQALREVVKQRVLDDPVEYNEGVLGMPADKYVAWITNKDHWGGEIEIAILSKHFQKQIAAFDIVSQQCLRYGESEGYAEMVALLYDGVHYDAMIMLPFAGAPEEFATTQFASSDERVIALAKELQAEAHRQRQFTDTAKFTLRCLVCQAGLVGERGAQEHAKSTGHTNFSEY